MKGLEILARYLNNIEYRRFMANIKRCRPTGVVRTNLYDREWHFPHCLISESFHWDDTPQGFDYWVNIYDKIETCSVKSVTPHKFIQTHRL